MIEDKRVLAVVPARGGSKGLPDKNLREICGKPLIAWSIEQGLGCHYIDSVLVSTDSPDIARIASRYGANVPFLRPKELATDESSSIDVLIHAIDYLKAEGDQSYDYVVLLEPTSPLRDISDITGALESLLNDDRLESVVGVAKAESTHPAFSYTIDAGLLLPAFGSHPTGLRRQDLDKEFYYLEGTVYVSSVSSLKRHKSFYHAATGPWIVARYKAIEIDELSDFIAAEALLRSKLEGILK